MKNNKSEIRYFCNLCIRVCAMLGIIIIMLLCAGAAINLVNKQTSSACSKEASLLSIGIGIIGFAIAVWAGLNISNLISRKEIDNLKEELERLKGISESEIRPFVEQNRAALLQQFLVELERMQDDPIAQYFLGQFRTISPKETDIPYAALIEIETLITQVTLRHRSAYAYDETLVALANNGLKKIAEVQNCHKVKQYLIYRKADFMFYKGYCDKDRLESVKDFMNTTKILITELSYDSLKKNFRSNDRAAAYLDNMLGEAYSKIVHYYTDVFGTEEGAKLERFLEKEMCRIDNIADAAIKYCEAAVRQLATSAYCRNLGCAYERRDRITVLNKGEKFAHKTEIIETYQHSVSEIMNDYVLDRETCRKAFHVLLMYYQKYLDYQFENSRRIGVTCKKCEEHISNMYSYAYIAKLEFPRCLVFQKLYIFSCYYVVQALSANVKIDAAHGKARKYFERQIEDTIKLLGYLDDADGKRDAFTKKIKSILKTIRSI